MIAERQDFGSAYAELTAIVRQAGLFRQQPWYYAWKMGLTLGLLCLGLGLLILFRHSPLVLVDAVFLGIVFGQLGFIGHDVGHRQIFRSRRLFEAASFAIGNFLLGWSWSWWVDKHNRHHEHPNDAEVDPDIGIPMLAFTEEEARKKRGLLRLMVRYQAYLFLPFELLAWLTFLSLSIGFLVTGKAKYPHSEASLMAVHYVLYFWLLFACLPTVQALLFFAVHRAIFGLYVGSVAAPNHKGMPVLTTDDRLDFLLRQVLTSRNVRAHPVTDFWYGGLNYQIDHHLFPTVARNRLKDLQRIVKSFCLERGIPYHETGFVESYEEIFQYLNEVGSSLARSG
jgi:fatty acid desaturase